jgi:hypothetical protein
MNERATLRAPRDAAPAGGDDAAHERHGRVAARPVAALAVALGFLALLVANLVHPVATGPYDNGDFKRIFATFSTGPGDLEFWPPDTTSDQFRRRFSYFHRFWRLDGGVAGAALPSTSNLLFLAARVPRGDTPGATFDLTANAIGLAVLLAAALLATLASLRATVPFVALSALALAMSDANVAGYLASFYQESGAFVYLLLYVCALFAFWQRRTRASCLAAVAACALLTATRFAYVPTGGVLVAPVLAAIATAPWTRSRKRALAAIAAATIVAVSGAALALMSDRTINKAAPYLFVFTTALPELPEEARAPYLSSLGLDPAGVAHRDENPFEPTSRFHTDPRLAAELGTPLLARAIARLAIDHPRAILRLVAAAFAHAGTYPPLTYAADGAATPGPIGAPWTGWSALHGALLNGWILYGAALVACVGLGVRVRRTRSDGWPLFFWIVAASFLGGSAVQALISMFGNGFVDLARHDFLATMLADTALVAGVAGLLQRA